MLSKEQMELVHKVEDQCCALMAGLGPQIQGAVMACLAARHLASFQGAERAEAKRILHRTAEQLVPIYRRGIIKSVSK